MRKSMKILIAVIVLVAGVAAAPMLHAQEPGATQDSTKESEKMGSGMMGSGMMGHGGMMDREKMKNMMAQMEQMKQMMETCRTMMQAQMEKAETETPSE